MQKYFAIAALAVMATALPALAATDQQTAMKTCSTQWSTMSATDRGTTKRVQFMSKCMKAPGAAPNAAAMTGPAMKPAAAGSMAMTAKPAAGSMAMTAKPAAGSMAKAATGGSAKCKDGTTVTYKNRKGTCSGHGGVASWM